jgi:hypothetical protein
MSFNVFNSFSNAFSASSGGGGAGFEQVNSFSDLPSPSLHVNEVYLVLSTEGLWLLNRKEAGLYKSTGSSWVRLGNWIDAFKDNNLAIYNSVDNTKLAKFDASAISTLTSRTYVLPDGDGIIALTTDIPNVWSVQNIDDTSVANTTYGGQLDEQTLDWRVKKVVGSTPTITIADHTNNLSYSDYASAWTNRLILTYS